MKKIIFITLTLLNAVHAARPVSQQNPIANRLDRLASEVVAKEFRWIESHSPVESELYMDLMNSRESYYQERERYISQGAANIPSYVQLTPATVERIKQYNQYICSDISSSGQNTILQKSNPRDFPLTRYTFDLSRISSGSLDSTSTDCSHFVHAVYAAAGYRYAYVDTGSMGSASNFTEVSEDDRTASDLVLFAGHVGILSSVTDDTDNDTVFSATTGGQYMRSVAIDEIRANRGGRFSSVIAARNNHMSTEHAVTPPNAPMSFERDPHFSYISSITNYRVSDLARPVVSYLRWNCQ